MDTINMKDKTQLVGKVRVGQNKWGSLLKRVASIAILLPLFLIFTKSTALAAGTLTPVGSPHQPIQIRSHHVNVVINNGFAKTEVFQTFFNPNAVDLEGIYSAPVPKSGSLSEFTIYVGEQEIHGEVLARDKANEIYEDEKKSGNDAGVANKNSFQDFQFKVSRVPAQQETRIRFVYYQPLVIDTGVGKYVYPLEEGGTDEVGKSFWTANAKVEDTLSAEFDVRMAYPIDEVRIPGFEAATTLDTVSEGHIKAKLVTTGVNLSRDLVLYYRLADNLPGRVELIPFRAEKDKPGSFMLVVTPGLDLKPVSGGADYVFILDVSGSMAGKIHTLAQGVKRALTEMKPGDRYRVVTFSSSAHALTRGWVDATSENVTRTIADVEQLGTGGSTNLYDGISLGLKGLDDDRVTSVILVTDAVTNTGVIQPAKFAELMKKYDVRVFGFLLGNSANWPLMRVIAESSGGFYAGVSNADDILGQIVLAKSKITHEALHDADLSVRGVKVFDATDEAIGKVYRGQQLVVFGRYSKPGPATVKLKARLSGEDKVYQTKVHFPEIDTDYPEIERLWAFERIEDIEYKTDLGLMQEKEAEGAIESLGVQYQLVTDHTSMLVLSDAAFARHGIERRNQVRIAQEQQAQARRYAQPIRNHRADSKQPMFSHRSSNIFSGGGAMDPISGGLALSLFGIGFFARRRREKRSGSKNK